jgi:hypothetical protein
MAEKTSYNEPGPPPEPLHDEPDGLAPPDFYDPVIEAYKRDVDRTLLRENLKLTVDQRARKMLDFIKAMDAIRGIAWRQNPPIKLKKEP